MNEEFFGPEQTPEESYQNYLDQLDAPRWYLEKTYPKFYEHFKERFEKFLSEWKTATKIDDFSKEFKDELFVTYCRYINAEIDYEPNYKEALLYIEKNGFKPKTPGRISMMESTFISVLETLFEFPELIIYTFKHDQEKSKNRIEELENKYGLYPKEMFNRAYELQQKAKSDRMKLTDENAIVKSNEKGNYFPAVDLINEDGKPTLLLFNITKTYSNYWKKKIKKENQP